MDQSERVRTAIFEVVKTQMREEKPPETLETYHRLKSQGYSEEETMKHLGSVVATEIFEVLEKGRTYDTENYIKALNGLPKRPSE